jgi:hypothetical protein
MSDHTTELWQAVRHETGSDYGEASTIWPQGAIVELAPADADRLVECVNALRGLEPAALAELIKLCDRAANADESLAPIDFHLALRNLGVDGP